MNPKQVSSKLTIKVHTSSFMFSLDKNYRKHLGGSYLLVIWLREDSLRSRLSPAPEETRQPSLFYQIQNQHMKLKPRRICLLLVSAILTITALGLCPLLTAES